MDTEKAQRIIDYERARYEEMGRMYDDLQHRHDHLKKLVKNYIEAYDALKYEYHHGNVASHSRENHKHDKALWYFMQFANSEQAKD